MIENVTLVAWLPLTVTVNGPEVAPDGTSAEILVSLQERAVAAVPLSTTVDAPCVEPNPEPSIVTELPTGPEVGVMPEMLGVCAQLDWP